MLRLQLLGILADIAVLPELAPLGELDAPTAGGALVDVEDEGNVLVGELRDLEQLRQDGPVVVGELLAGHGGPVADAVGRRRESLREAESPPEPRAQPPAARVMENAQPWPDLLGHPCSCLVMRINL